MEHTTYPELDADTGEENASETEGDEEWDPNWGAGTQYEDKRSPTIRFGTLSPGEQKIHGRRSWDPADSPSKRRVVIPTHKTTFVGIASSPVTESQEPLPSTPIPNPFAVSPTPFTPQERVETELQLVDIEIELLRDNLGTLKRKHNNDVDMLENSIRALKKKRDALCLLNMKK